MSISAASIPWRGALLTGATAVAAVGLLDPSDLSSTPSARGELVVAVGFLALVGVAGLLVGRFAAWDARLARLPRWVLPASGFVVWAIGWAVVLQLRDPRWLASGIDWHDAYLGAYALRYDDPAFYCASRYPLYPALGAWLSAGLGLGLDVALQVVSRACGVLLAIPLWVTGRALFGRAAATVGVLLLLALPTFQHHIDAATPYPLYMLCVAVAAAGLVLAWEGGLGAFLAVGVGLGAAMATDSKALALLLALAPGAILAVVFARTGRAWPPAIGLRLVRVAAVVLPVWGSYAWMASLPVTPLSLEAVAAPTLFPRGWSHQDYAAYTRGGYVWGHFTRPDQIQTTLRVFREFGRREDMGPERARRRDNTVVKARMDYPVGSLAPVYLSLAALGVPLVRRWRQAHVPVLQVGTVLAVGATVVPSLLDDYQDRYLAHALPFVAVLVAGGADAVARLVIGGGTPGRRHARLLVCLVEVVVCLTWTGFPHALGNILPRLDPISRGGSVEREVAAWADGTMQPDDVLLDTTWLMNGCIAAGLHTVLREDPAYPPAGAPSRGWRATRPRRGVMGQAWALLGSGEPPAGNHRWTPERLMASADWTLAWTSQDGFTRVYRYVAAGVPPGWSWPPSDAATTRPSPQLIPGPPTPQGPPR